MKQPYLTPEMMARAIVSEPDWWQPGPEFLIDFDRLREHIAHAIAFDRGYTIPAAIRAAVAEEREACAKTAETMSVFAAREVAAAIRARDERG